MGPKQNNSLYNEEAQKWKNKEMQFFHLLSTVCFLQEHSVPKNELDLFKELLVPKMKLTLPIAQGYQLVESGQ